MSETNTNPLPENAANAAVNNELQDIKEAIELLKKGLAGDDIDQLMPLVKNYHLFLQAYYQQKGITDDLQLALQDLYKFVDTNPAASANMQLLMKNPEFIALTISNYKKALELNPADENMADQLYGLLFDSGDFETMKEVFQKLADLFPTNELHLPRLAFAKLKLKEFEAAITDLKEVLAHYPGNYVAYNNMGFSYERLGNIEQAKECYHAALSLNYAYTLPSTALKKIYETEKNWQAVADLFKLLIEKGQASAGNYFELAFAEFELGHLETSIDLYKKVLEFPDYASPHLAKNNIGVAFERLKKYADAKEAYTQSISLNPNFANAYYNRAIVSDILGEENNMMADLVKCLETDPKYSNAIYKIWLLYTNQKKYTALETLLQDLLKKQNPADGETVYRLAQTQHKLYNFEPALENYNKAVELQYNDPECLLYRAILFGDMEKQDDATTAYQQLILQYPDYEYGYYNYAYQMLEKKKYSDAINILNGACGSGTKEARKYYELGNAYLDSLAYSKALKAYDEALKIEPDYVYAMHNKAWVFEKLGDYQTARKQWKAIVDIYSDIIKKGEDPDLAFKAFYCGEILNYSLQSQDYDRVEKMHLTSIGADRYYTPPYLSLVRLYQQRKQQMHDNGSEDDFHALKNEWHIKMLDAYSTGIEIVKKEVARRATKQNLAELGEFFLSMDKYEEAADQFKKALEKDEQFVKGFTGLGVAQARLEQYKDAISNFKKAAALDPDDLNVQSNLGDAYRKAEMYEQAESIFQKILKNTPFYIDAHMGLGECYKTLGDKAMEEKDTNQAEEYFSKAKGLFEKALNLSKSDDKVSKRINDAEKSAVNYSLGYTKVRLFEMKKGLDLLLLQSAEKDFKSIRTEQDEYFKAQKAVKKIKERIYTSFSVKKAAPLFIFVMAVLIFGVVQYVFYFNRYQQKDLYSLNKKELIAYMASNPIDSVGPKLKSWSAENFSTIEEFHDKLEEVIPAKYLEKLPASVMNTTKVDVRENISELSYGFFSFGALVFMVVGLFLKDITRLKLGSIEMDKNAVDNLSTSTSLGVMK